MTSPKEVSRLHIQIKFKIGLFSLSLYDRVCIENNV